MIKKPITWLSSKSAKKPDTVSCPVCSHPRNKGNHQQCSRITQLKGMKDRGEIK
ncbi:MAG: hypothetical protein Q8S55_17260 [Methylococcaceae bacterium]|nr:hypothetical protein [Methylococcaceae bacterium]